MFKSIQFTKGFALDLPGISDHTFEFQDGINVVYGPNGSGKTTILKTLAAYTGLDMQDKGFGGGAGWSRSPNHNVYGTDKFNLLDILFSKAPGKCRALIDWDGMPAFYNSATLSDTPTMTHLASSAEDSADGITDIGLQLAMITGHQSEGELRKMKVGTVIQALAKAPTLSTKAQHKDDRVEKAYIDFVKKLPRDGPRTLLWDEPDRSLDAETQIDFWLKWIPRLVKKFNIQIIASSHSFVPPLLAEAKTFNVVELHEGKIREMRSSMLALLQLSFGEGDKEEKSE